MLTLIASKNVMYPSSVHIGTEKVGRSKLILNDNHELFASLLTIKSGIFGHISFQMPEDGLWVEG